MKTKKMTSETWNHGYLGITHMTVNGTRYDISGNRCTDGIYISYSWIWGYSCTLFFPSDISFDSCMKEVRRCIKNDLYSVAHYTDHEEKGSYIYAL